MLSMSKTADRDGMSGGPSPPLARRVLLPRVEPAADRGGRRSALDARLDRLRTRPLEIVLCHLAGDTDRQIAARLGVSRSTVGRDLRGVLAAFGLASRRHLRDAFGR
jgi:DNA-binding CsgD family transcriptional regulator